MFIKRSLKFFIIVMAVVLALSTMAFAFANSIVVPDSSNAGYGPGDVGGYTVTGIEYTLANDPIGLTSVKLTLDTAATGVNAKVTGENWVGCDNVDDIPTTVWTCDVGGVVEAVTQLEVAAYTDLVP
jgi:hypothetical protein